jgi:flagellin-like hook-associated protein FlgL
MTKQELAQIKKRIDRLQNGRSFQHMSVWILVMQDIPALLAEVERLQEKVETLEQSIRNLDDVIYTLQET